MPLSSVPIIDISNNQIGLTAGENVYVDLSTFKYGSGSVYFSGSANSEIKFSSNPKFGFSTGNFSIEMWINPQPSPLTYTTLFSVGSASNGILMRLNSLSGDNLYIAGTEYNWDAGNVKNNEWSHIVLSRELSVVKVFVNGSITLSSFNGANLGDSEDLIIGNSKSNPTEYYKGYIDDIHIVNSATFYPVATLSGNEIGKNIAWYTNGVKSTPAQAAIQAELSGVGDGVIGEFGSFYTAGSAASPEEIVGYIDFSGFGDGITGLSGKLYSNGNAYTGQGTSDIGVNGTWYTEGFVSSPSQAATQSNFTGQGDGIIGDDNVWYTNGIESTPTEAALQANYSGLGDGIIGENNVWYLNGVTANPAQIAQLTNFTGLGDGTVGDSSVWYYNGQQSTTEQAAAQQLALDTGFTGKGDGTTGILNEWYTSGNKSTTDQAADQRAVESNLTGYGDGTIGRNGIYYADGIARNPSEMAFLLSFTGLGNGTIGNSGTWYTNGYQSTPAEAVIQANFTGQGDGTVGESGTWYTNGSQSTPAQAAAQSNFTGQGDGTIGESGTWYTGGGLSTPAQAAAQSNFSGKGNGTIGIANVWYTNGNPSNTSQILAQASNLTGLGGEVKPVEINEVRVSTFNGTIQTNNSALSNYPSEASFYFNSSNSNIMNLSGYDDAVFDTGDFTIELWFKLNSITTYSPLILKGTGYNGGPGGWTNDWFLYHYSTTNQIFLSRYSDVNVVRGFNYTPTVNVWTHLALCKKNGILTAYINGVSLGSQTDTTNYFDNLDSGMQLGASVMANAWQYLDGSVTNVRVVAGKALYLSNFTVPTYPLTLTSGTDYKNYKLPSTPTYVSDITPFNDVNAEDGSLYFMDGDFLTRPKSSDTDIPSGTFTIETWVRLDNITGPRTITTNYGGPWDGWVISVENGVPRVNLSGDAPDIVSTTTLQVNTWYHIAVAGSPGSYKMFINGIQEGSTFTGGTVLNGGSVYVGKLVAGGRDYDYFNGYISNLRIVNGTALYTSNFTPPTAPLSNIVNTSVLLKAPYSLISIIGTTLTPFSGSNTEPNSLYFNGTSDYITVPASSNFNFASGTFTIEAWVRFDDLNNHVFASTWSSTTAGWTFQYNVGKLEFNGAGNPAHIRGTSDLQPNTWYHVAVAGSPGSYKMFLNGVQEGSTYTGGTALTGGALNIGAFTNPVVHLHKGYISNFRILNGTALYTSNFTPPTAPLTNITNTVYLLKSPYDQFDRAGSSSYKTPFGTGIDGSIYLYGQAINIPYTSFDPTPSVNNILTYELWMYTLDMPGPGNSCRLIMTGPNASTHSLVWLSFGPNGNVVVGLPYHISTVGITTPDNAIQVNTWHHVAVTLNGSNASIFVDGKSKASVSNFTRPNPAKYDLRIGYVDGTATVNHVYRGYISNFRITRGIELYTSDFDTTVPISPLSPLSATDDTLILMKHPYDTRFVKNYNTPFLLKGVTNGIEDVWYTNGNESTPNQLALQTNFTGQGNGTIGTNGVWYTNGQLSTPAQIAAQTNFTGLGDDIIGDNLVWYTNGQVSNAEQLAVQENFTGLGNGILGTNGVWYTNGYPSGNSELLIQALSFTGLGGEIKPVELNKVRIANFDGDIQTNNSAFSGHPNEVSFDFNTDTMTLTGYNDCVFGADEFTIELWFKLDTISRWIPLIMKGTGWDSNPSYPHDWMVALDSNKVYFSRYAGSDNAGKTFDYTYTTGVWTHLAVCKNDGLLTVYINGVSIGRQSDNVNYSNSTNLGIQLGKGYISQDWRYIDGSITNARVIAGKALYTSNFTVPASPLTLYSGITYHNYKSLKSPTYASDITPFSGANTEDGSLYFNGTDYLHITNSNFNLGTNNFTIECWVNANYILNNYNHIFSLGYYEHGGILVRCATNGTTDNLWFAGNTYDWNSNINLLSNRWQHFALVRYNNILSIYVDGVSKFSVDVTGKDMGSAKPLFLGTWSGSPGSSLSLIGYISNFRIVNGTAVYTSNFQVPTEPLTNVTNTALLLKAPYTPFAYEAVAGNPTLSSASPFGGGVDGSMYFGSGNSVQIANTTDLGLGTDNFTIELWAQRTSNGTVTTLFELGTLNVEEGILLRRDALYISSGATQYTWCNDTTFPINQWKHIAICRNDDVLTTYINGVSSFNMNVGSINFGSSRALTLGTSRHAGGESQFFLGYISNFRVVKGTALYTSNFTPPTSSLSSTDNTSLLIKHPYNTRYSKKYNTPFLLKGVTNGLPDFWYTNGTVSTPAQVAGQTYFTGQGNDIIGDGGVWYTNGSVSTPAQIAGQTNFTGLGDGTIGDYGVLYINGVQSTPSEAAYQTNFTGLGDGTIGIYGLWYANGRLFSHLGDGTIGQYGVWYYNGEASNYEQASAQNIAYQMSYTGLGDGSTGISNEWYVNGYPADPQQAASLSNFTGLGNGTMGANGVWYTNGTVSTPAQAASQTNFTGLGNGTIGDSGVWYTNGSESSVAQAAAQSSGFTGLGDGTIGTNLTFYTSGNESTGSQLLAQQGAYAYQVNHTGWGTNVAGYEMYYYINGAVEVASISGITSNYIGIGNGLTGRNGYYYHYGTVDKDNDIAYRNYIYYTVTIGNGLHLLNNTQLLNWNWRNYSYSLFLGTGLIGENDTYYLISPQVIDPQRNDITITQSDWPSLSTRAISSITVSNSAYVVPGWNPVSTPFNLYREISRVYSPSQFAVVNNYTGQGDGISGNLGYYYYNGVSITSATSIGNQFVVNDGPFDDSGYSLSYSSRSYTTLETYDNAIPATGEFTIEFFVKSSSWNYYYFPYGVAFMNNAAENMYVQVNPTADKYAPLIFWVNGTYFTSTAYLSTGLWYHVAITRTSNDYIKFYFNGILNTTLSGNNVTIPENKTWKVGSIGTDAVDGLISNIRMTKSCIYNGNFTPPTSMLSAIQNTSIVYTYPYLGKYQASVYAGLNGVGGTTNGPLSSATFTKPWGIAYDSQGNVFVSDYEHHVIRKITKSTGIVSTFAGAAGVGGSTNATGSAARFYYPAGICTDTADNIYVADSGNNKIRKITSAGVVTTLTGPADNLPGYSNTSTIRFNTPTGVAYNPSNGILYIADKNNHVIRKININGTGISTLAGPNTVIIGNVNGTGTAARFYFPIDVSVDLSGNIYVVDEYNHCIRKITAAGAVTTFVGSSAGVTGEVDGFGLSARFVYPASIYIDSRDDIYVGTATGVKQITRAGRVTTIANKNNQTGTITNGEALSSVFGTTYGIVAKDNEILTTDFNAPVIRKITRG